MRILLAGAKGFLGAAIAKRLQKAGHELTLAVRDTEGLSRGGNYVTVDFTSDTKPERWIDRLNGIDAVINAVGVLDASDQALANTHTRTPAALAKACAAKGIHRFIQVSAHGLDLGVETGYFKSKRAGEKAILEALPSAQIIRPGLVYGERGASSRMFRKLTALPVVFYLTLAAC